MEIALMLVQPAVNESHQ